MSKPITVDAAPGSGPPCVEPCGEGRFVLRCPAELARRARTELVDVLAASVGEAGPGELILDLGSVEFLNSAGIGAIFSVRRHVVDRGGTVVVCNVRPTVRRLLAAVNLPDLIPVLGDLGKAHSFLDQPGGQQQ